MVTEKGREARESAIASGWTVEGETSEAEIIEEETLDIDSASDESERSQLSNGALVLFGLIGGVYLLYTIVWFSWASAKSIEYSSTLGASGTIDGVLQQIVVWLSMFAPALWFFSVLLLNKESGFMKKAIWLLLGLFVLVPLPMFGGMF